MCAVAIFSNIYSLEARCDIWGTYIKWFLTFQTSRNESSSLFMPPLLFIFYCVRYIVSLFLLLPDIWLFGGSGQNVHWEYLSHSKDSCCPFPLDCFLLTIPAQDNWGKKAFHSFIHSFLFSSFLEPISPILPAVSACMSNPLMLVT